MTSLAIGPALDSGNTAWLLAASALVLLMAPIGTFGIGLIATRAAPTGVDGLFYGGGLDQLGKQLLGGGVVLVYAFVVSGIIGYVVHRTMGFRIDEEHEVGGIDLVLHAESAYDLHATTGTPTSPGGPFSQGGLGS